MLNGLGRIARYVRAWTRGPDVTVQETEIERGGAPVPATLVLPRQASGALPGWVVLGGATRMGRFHPQLLRFAGAMASSGAAVLLPEVDEWRDLDLAPSATTPTVRASIRALRARSEVRPDQLGLVGFCFGGPQVLIASTEEDIAGALAGVVVFGGYCDLERTLRCQFTGIHEWQGVEHHLKPDPYGRWVLAANYLVRVPGCEDAGDVAAALRRLASSASELRIPAWDPRHDPLKAELRARIAAARQNLFDLFAPPSPTVCCRPEEGVAMAEALAGACRLAEPLLDPTPHLSAVRVPTRLMHGRDDRVIPYTESLRLREKLPDTVESELTVTGLFGHSATSRPASLAAHAREVAVFMKGLHGVLTTVP